MGVATKLPSARVDGGRVVGVEGMTVAVFDGIGVTTSRVGDGVREAIGGGVNDGGGDTGVGFGKANSTTLIAMTAIANKPSEYRKIFQLKGYFCFKELSVEKETKTSPCLYHNFL